MPKPEALTKRHPIGVVARRTGLKPDLIRAWERRYRAVKPSRDPDNQRVYSDADIERLGALRNAIERGWKIGQIARLDDEALSELGATTTATPATAAGRARSGEADPRLDSFVTALNRLQSRELNFILEQAAIDVGPGRAIAELVQPVLHRAESLRKRGRLRRMHLTLARSVVRSFLAELAGRGFALPDSAPSLIVAGLPGHSDNLEALAVAAMAACEGWRVTLLGSDLPAEEIIAAADQIEAWSVALIPGLGTRPELERIRRHLQADVGLIIATPDNLDMAPSTGVYVGPLSTLQPILARLREQPPPVRRRPTPHRWVALPTDPTSPGALLVRRSASARFGLDPAAFAPDGCLTLRSLDDVRLLAHRVNSFRDNPEAGVSAGQINAASLLHDYAHRLIERYLDENDSRALTNAVRWLEHTHGERSLHHAFQLFVEAFGFKPQESAALAVSVMPSPPEAVLEEMIVVWLLNRNPAMRAVRELFDDTDLDHSSDYQAILGSLSDFFASQPGLGAGQRSLLSLLCLPFTDAPHSLIAQLEILVRLEGELAVEIVERLLRAIDLLREEQQPVFVAAGAAPAPKTPLLDPDAFDLASSSPLTPDSEWMPGLVLAAKHTLVWLDQISRSSGRPVTRLDAIPDRELERLASFGISGLWLIGLWERSRASERIKRMTGNPEAAASAYSLADYRIAEALGGEEALSDLARRARGHGIRLGCDVVANHMGIDSPWVIDHPEWFLSLPQSPFPSYTFSEPDLSADSRVALYLADQYYDRSDAPVVFKRHDRLSGEIRYVYHGNDGTSLPWNDTAQLDYTSHAVREAMIRTIVAVARRFPIIRFDAAMTLARRHIQRLWFPPPGAGGAIPSRSAHGISQQDFDRLMPQEFWREVVDRVSREAPDTMLLAEAFWLLEGYFVRNLGMHRVYNSAFMHLLRDEENDKFKSFLKNTLERDPQMLARLVNFVTNPDERPACEQLGRGDKYFAICTLMATLPGLPMFGHGQIEGLTEKYGMEYRRAYHHEAADPDLIERHKREIVPLLVRRRHFSSSNGFRLFDLQTPSGTIDHNVIAFVSRDQAQASLVVVHNRNQTTAGRIHRACAFRDVNGTLVVEDVWTALGAPSCPRGVLIESRTGYRVEVSAGTVAEHGLELSLGPFEVHVLDFHPSDSQEL